MTDSQAPKRLHYAWVVVLAFVLMFGGLACLHYQHTPGPGHEIWPFVLFGALFSTPLLGGVLSIWLCATWSVFGETRPWRGRTWVALLPALFFFGYVAVTLAADPPSPQRQFQRYFHADLPVDARNIKVLPPALPDPGYAYFAFSCSKQSTSALIKELVMEPGPDEHVSGMEILFSRIAGDWSKQDWEKSLQFGKSERTGTGYILVTDALMERVLMTRQPLLSKSEEEMLEK